MDRSGILDTVYRMLRWNFREPEAVTPACQAAAEPLRQTAGGCFVVPGMVEV